MNLHVCFHRPEPPKSHLLSRVRNDSDIHLEGVLLDGDVSHTSPEGSNWSLNSCSSSQSSKSHGQDHPPTYFQVSQDSWEDCNGAQHLLMSQYHSNGSFAQPISNPKLTTNGSLATSCMITASMMNSTNTLPSSSLTSSNGDNGFNGEISKSTASPSCSQTNFLHCPASSLANTGSRLGKENGTSNGTNGLLNGGHHGRTSPVAVPTSNRLTSHSHQVRPESKSNSSASIGRLVVILPRNSYFLYLWSSLVLGTSYNISISYLLFLKLAAREWGRKFERYNFNIRSGFRIFPFQSYTVTNVSY